ncbi:MAG: hypothetical protein AAGE76_10125 [Pseudomonadota bacterium]
MKRLVILGIVAMTAFGHATPADALFGLNLPQHQSVHGRLIPQVERRDYVLTPTQRQIVRALDDDDLSTNEIKRRARGFHYQNVRRAQELGLDIEEYRRQFAPRIGKPKRWYRNGEALFDETWWN